MSTERNGVSGDAGSSGIPAIGWIMMALTVTLVAVFWYGVITSFYVPII